MAKNKKLRQASKKTGGNKVSFKVLLLLFVIIIVSLLYLPMAFLFFIGMLPTYAVYLTDRGKGKNKTFTIGALNFSGCFYYLMKSWTNPYPMEAATDYLSDPMTMVIIYALAGLGYAINYVMTGMVSSILREKARLRLDALEKKKKKLEERWGRKVRGDKPVDAEVSLTEDSAKSE